MIPFEGSAGQTKSTFQAIETLQHVKHENGLV
jgi:hypothetical protein